MRPLARGTRWLYRPWTVCRVTAVLTAVTVLGFPSGYTGFNTWALVPWAMTAALLRHAARTWETTQRLLAEANQAAHREGDAQ